jgi:hypothetical protein
MALDGVASSKLAVQLVPERLARRHFVVLLQVDNRTLTYATCRPFNDEADRDLAFASGRRTSSGRDALGGSACPRPLLSEGEPAGRAR